MKKKNALMLSILLLLVVVTGGMVSLMYSRYLSSASGTSTAKVAPWKISVNGDDIVEESTFTASDITWSQSDYISDGYIVPSRSGSFDVVIDPTGSKVAVQYEISLDTTSMAQYSQINISSVKIGNETLTATADGKYVGIINLGEVEANTTKTITVNVVWANSDANNTSDTTGSFYITFDEDASILNYIFSYQINNSKVGFPLSSINKVKNVLDSKKINYVVFADNNIEIFEKEDNCYACYFSEAKKKSLIFL